jgi:hypothetical protein
MDLSPGRSLQKSSQIPNVLRVLDWPRQPSGSQISSLVLSSRKWLSPLDGAGTFSLGASVSLRVSFRISLCLRRRRGLWNRSQRSLGIILLWRRRIIERGLSARFSPRVRGARRVSRCEPAFSGEEIRDVAIGYDLLRPGWDVHADRGL